MEGIVRDGVLKIREGLLKQGIEWHQNQVLLPTLLFLISNSIHQDAQSLSLIHETLNCSPRGQQHQRKNWKLITELLQVHEAKTKRTEKKIDKATTWVVYFNTSLSLIDETSKQRIRKGM